MTQQQHSMGNHLKQHDMAMAPQLPCPALPFYPLSYAYTLFPSLLTHTCTLNSHYPSHRQHTPLTTSCTQLLLNVASTRSSGGGDCTRRCTRSMAALCTSRDMARALGKGLLSDTSGCDGAGAPAGGAGPAAVADGGGAESALGAEERAVMDAPEPGRAVACVGDVSPGAAGPADPVLAL